MFRLFKHYIDVSTVILFLSETIYLLVQSVVIFNIFQTIGITIDLSSGIILSIVVALVTVSGMACVGLYNRHHFVHYQDVFSRSLVILPIVLLSIGFVLFVRDRIIAEHLQTGQYALCIATLTVFFPVLLAWRAAFIRLIDRTDTLKRRVLILGSGKRAAKIEKLNHELSNRAINIVGYVRFGTRPEPVGPLDQAQSADHCRRSVDRRTDYWIVPQNLPKFCAEKRVEELVVASAERRGLPVYDLLACKLRGIQVTEYASFWERESGQVDLEEISPSWLLFSDGFSIGTIRSFLKRTFDITISSIVLILTLPLTIPTAILIKLESRGPLFYRQERVGMKGKPFMVLKFRSMCDDAEKDGPRWAAKNDARVTKVGAFIRKVRIDEIPQVINVLKGDMAFVGPRPERPVFVTALAEKIPYYNERHVAKPGITGWAQINYPYGATEYDAKMKLTYDLYYIKNCSLFLDIIIIMQTVKVLLWNQGAR
ncbi:TIGR03013 family XrtA/PEP-CTERM system glycosyltransferase [Telmatospirillum sp.]|uniref:TIGR03013 family XrtA/PEP-CTERM system glycosyltransferase n=1 Tax=Telmatospirillum sp. TaxID=2079197 RepID=UPI0028503B41|nr:TIGR03013 family XrtA/PEP-CTERM system glycosyltransferase [Telmatospirillum sp.]MDR3437883.1 TIGR03013 family PEP-CTERM/XrtA system glycosyltransferase [Telmatospirillum sp.]